MIAFDHQDEVRFLGDDFVRRFTLTMHGIGRDDRARQVEHVDQLLHGRDFVRFILDRLERNAHFQTARPSGHGMQGRFVRGFVERAAERLAIEGHGFAFQGLSNVHRPRFQGRVELERIEPGEQLGKRVMRGNALFKRQKFAEPSQLALAKRRDIDPGVAIANRAAQRHENHFDERIVGAAIQTGIGNIFKVFANSYQRKPRTLVHLLASKPQITGPPNEAFPTC